MCNKQNWAFAEPEDVGPCTEASGRLLPIITKTHQPRGGGYTHRDNTLPWSLCLLPTIHHSVSTNPRGNFTLGQPSWSSWKTCTRKVHSPKVLQMQRDDGSHHSGQSLKTDFGFCSWRLVDGTFQQRWEEQQKKADTVPPKHRQITFCSRLFFSPVKLKVPQLVISNGEAAPCVPRMNKGDASDISV